VWVSGFTENGIFLAPFIGSGTTAVFVEKLGKNYVGFELISEHIKITRKKLKRELGYLCNIHLQNRVLDL